MVDPALVLRDSVLKYLELFVLVLLLAKVNDPVLLTMAMGQAVRHSLSIVAVNLLNKVARRIAHCDDARRDVRHVQVKTVLLQAFLLPRDHTSYEILHIC